VQKSRGHPFLLPHARLSHKTTGDIRILTSASAISDKRLWQNFWPGFWTGPGLTDFSTAAVQADHSQLKIMKLVLADLACHYLSDLII